jgi:hypothetical protein
MRYGIGPIRQTLYRRRFEYSESQKCEGEVNVLVALCWRCRSGSGVNSWQGCRSFHFLGTKLSPLALTSFDWLESILQPLDSL